MDTETTVGLTWVRQAAPGVPYFMTDDGVPWTPIGDNESTSWINFEGLRQRRDLPSVENYLRTLRAGGIGVLRLMLEYAEKDDHYLESPMGTYSPEMLQMWDDLFLLCERTGMRLLLTPYDTFFMWNRFAAHPYAAVNGGTCPDRTQLLVCEATRAAISARLAFATRRWGASGVVFAWDLWNELHPCQADNQMEAVTSFIDEVSADLRDLEMRLHGRAHLQTMSIFCPELEWKPWLNAPIFRHPGLDFANVHIYEEGTIDYPSDTVVPAISTGRLMRTFLSQIHDGRPLFDSENGPIHVFKDHGVQLPEDFDDEYFRHMQWAHFASGAAGGGMRWPNRHPHVLTPGMRQAQGALARFLPLIDWTTFRSRNLNEDVEIAAPGLAACACGDDRQAVVWLLRTNATAGNGMMRPGAAPVETTVRVPGLAPGRYRAVPFDTRNGTAGAPVDARADAAGVVVGPVQVTHDLALALQRVE